MNISKDRLFLYVSLIVGLFLRVVILSQTSTLRADIIDEQQYSKIANNLLDGNCFPQLAGSPTSIRPPLYPGLLAALWSTVGRDNLQAVRLLQFLLTLATAWLVYLLATRIYDQRVGRIAAGVCWL